MVFTNSLPLFDVSRTGGAGGFSSSEDMLTVNNLLQFAGDPGKFNVFSMGGTVKECVSPLYLAVVGILTGKMTGGRDATHFEPF